MFAVADAWHSIKLGLRVTHHRLGWRVTSSVSFPCLPYCLFACWPGLAARFPVSPLSATAGYFLLAASTFGDLRGQTGSQAAARGKQAGRQASKQASGIFVLVQHPNVGLPRRATRSLVIGILIAQTFAAWHIFPFLHRFFRFPLPLFPGRLLPSASRCFEFHLGWLTAMAVVAAAAAAVAGARPGVSSPLFLSKSYFTQVCRQPQQAPSSFFSSSGELREKHHGIRRRNE